MTPMTNAVVDHLGSAVTMWNELMEGLGDGCLDLRLGGLRSNTIGQQLWCLGGCRESNLAALREDRPFSWRCSYDGTTSDHEPLVAYVTGQGAAVLAFLAANPDLSPTRAKLALGLLAHEFQHQGQMIRYLYGNGLAIPASWRSYWALEP